jgi:cation transport protein ChaC
MVLLTEEERRASLAAFLAARPSRGDLWLFAYGSLIWNPLIFFEEKRVGTVRGWHRSFCLWTQSGRGTKARPGLTLGLEPGGSCCGLAFRIAESESARELDIVWRREMLTGVYLPRWVGVESAEGRFDAVAFRVNRAHPRYAGRLPEETVVAAIAAAQGPLGACATYLFNTVQHLEELGVTDRRLSHLSTRVAARLNGAAP